MLSHRLRARGGAGKQSSQSRIFIVRESYIPISGPRISLSTVQSPCLSTSGFATLVDRIARRLAWMVAICQTRASLTRMRNQCRYLPSTDIFSLGSILYTIQTGHWPHKDHGTLTTGGTVGKLQAQG